MLLSLVYFGVNPPRTEVVSWQQIHPWTYWQPGDASGPILARVPWRPPRPRRARWPRRPGWSSLSLISLLGGKINTFPALLMWYCWMCWKLSSHRIMKTERQNDGWLWAASIHNMEEEGFFWCYDYRIWSWFITGGVMRQNACIRSRLNELHSAPIYNNQGENTVEMFCAVKRENIQQGNCN